MPFLHYTLPFWPSHLCSSCTVPFNFDQESLMSFLHCTHQFWPRVTYALLALYPSILTKSHLCPSCTVPINFDQRSLMPFLHYTLQVWPRVTYAQSCTVPINFDQGSLMLFLHYNLQFWARITLILPCSLHDLNISSSPASRIRVMECAVWPGLSASSISSDSCLEDIVKRLDSKKRCYLLISIDKDQCKQQVRAVKFVELQLLWKLQYLQRFVKWTMQ